jgi:hypothetical protein
MNNQMPRLALTALAFVVLAAAACNGDNSPSGDDSTPAGGSPSPEASPDVAVTPIITPGLGHSPTQAVGTYVAINGIDGHQLDTSGVVADCPMVEPTVTTSPIAGPPEMVSSIFLGQFCISIREYEAETSATAIVELPTTDESWEMMLEFDREVNLWKVEDVEKVSG